MSGYSAKVWCSCEVIVQGYGVVMRVWCSCEGIVQGYGVVVREVCEVIVRL